MTSNSIVSGKTVVRLTDTHAIDRGNHSSTSITRRHQFISPAESICSSEPERNELPLETVCGACGAVLYSGFDLKSPKDVAKHSMNKCKSCGKVLSSSEFIVEVSKA
jgi:hypothetical protein